MWERVLDFLFPLECIACGGPRAHCCPRCLGAVGRSVRAFEADGLRVFSAFAYGHPVVRRLIHDLKYRGWTAAAGPIDVLARRAAVTCGASLGDAETLVVPVPLSRLKLRARGFNQAETIARAVASTLGARLETGNLVRTRDTRPQTEADDRSLNVHGAFGLLAPSRARDRDCLLVDDVWTSGSTLRACDAVLREAGARSVRGFALAWGGDIARKDPTVVS